MRQSRVLPTALGALAMIAAASLGAGAIADSKSSQSGLSCEIASTDANGMFALRGIVHATASLAGTFNLDVSGSGGGGSTSVSQAGTFTVNAGEPTPIGNVTVSNNGQTYTVTLVVEAGGTRVTCTETLGMRI